MGYSGLHGLLDKISKRTVDTVKYSMGLEKRSLDPKSRNHCQRHKEIGLRVYLQLNDQLNSLSEHLLRLGTE